MFITEKELVIALKENYFSICDWNTQKYNTSILEEVNLGFGIADLVIAKVTIKDFSNKTQLTYFDAIIYNLIQTSKKISIQKIQEITKADDKVISKSLNRLLEDSYIHKKDSLITFRRTYQGISKDSIAIEAKLKNWKRALDQAFRYKWFAKKSFVVLDSSNIRPAIKNIVDFKKMNVGLAEISTNGEVLVHFNPVKKEPIDFNMWLVFNEKLKSSLARE